MAGGMWVEGETVYHTRSAVGGRWQVACGENVALPPGRRCHEPRAGGARRFGARIRPVDAGSWV